MAKAAESKMPKAPKGNGPQTKVTMKSPSMADDERKWRAKDDMRMISQAKEIEDDPQRMKAAQDCAKEEMGRLARAMPAIKVEVAERTIPKVKAR